MTLAENKNGKEESCASELAAPTSYPYHKVGAASSLAQLSSLPFWFSARVIRLSRSQKSVLNFFRRRRPPISLDESWPALQVWYEQQSTRSNTHRAATWGRDEGSEQVSKESHSALRRRVRIFVDRKVQKNVHSPREHDLPRIVPPSFYSLKQNGWQRCRL